ncbi:MAG: maleylpyruvate isomerase family mycothiol-dependent enzyme [Panacagrimonas sp.]
MSKLDEVGFVREEAQSLAALLADLTAADWERPTPFKNWTPWDVIAHLHLSDLWACASLRSRDDFAGQIKPLLAALQRRTPLRDYTRQRFETLDGPALLAVWQDTIAELCAGVDAADANTRLAWFGPDTGLRSFVTARYMETWAHAQDVYDLLGRQRVYTDALHVIATLGVKTYEFCFRNRGQKTPQPAPRRAFWCDLAVERALSRALHRRTGQRLLSRRDAEPKCRRDGAERTRSVRAAVDGYRTMLRRTTRDSADTRHARLGTAQIRKRPVSRPFSRAAGAAIRSCWSAPARA